MRDAQVKAGVVTALVVTYAATAKAHVIAATAYSPAVSQAMAAMAMTVADSVRANRSAAAACCSGLADATSGRLGIDEKA